ncbi:DNA mismatch repair protein MutS [Aquimarina sp. 2201CG5-10]|uniref:DNA mismatch repair protein MutS n=1 Tax=Aquimarina callyspongiae TaxID=3098150 RepID=UPI002AB4E03F|nr:DNA mismatch repair protein MutS [Aquimarina sp. 2201CG5-10]MDY8138976.1 DNA mismatch repair protein MutS [Aquimarina sp. 2201CG5-10]
MIKIGDIVSVLDEPITGKVIALTGEEITIETEDGFDMTFFLREVVKISSDEMIIPSYEEVNKNLQEKEIFKKKPKRSTPKPKERHLPPMEVDLHINKLVKSTKGMSNHDIVTLQLDTAQRQLDFAIHKRIPKIVFIHGVGQGVLKEELKYLFGRYDNVRISDGDYKKYGLGAMEVYVIQNPK